MKPVYLEFLPGLSMFWKRFLCVDSALISSLYFLILLVLLDELVRSGISSPNRTLESELTKLIL